MGNRDWDHTCATRHMCSVCVCGVCKVIHVVCACSCKVGEPPEEKGVQKIQMASGNFLTVEGQNPATPQNKSPPSPSFNIEPVLVTAPTFFETSR